MAKKVKKKLKIKLLPLFVFIILLVVGYFAVMLCTKIPIKNIYVINNNIVTDQEIIELAGIDDYPSFLSTSISKMKKKILKNPYIKDVKITKQLLAEVHIRVIEHQVLLRKQENNKLVLEDLTELDNNENIEVPTLLNYVPNDKYATLINKMLKVDDEILKKISEMTYTPNDKDADRFLLYMNDGNSVYLNLTKWKQINYYDDVVPQLEGKKGILNLDNGNHFEIIE